MQSNINNIEQDFADRYIEYFGGRKHFGFLTRACKKYGLGRCEEIISAMKDSKNKINNKIAYFNKVINVKRVV